MDSRLQAPAKMLRLAIGLMALLAGVDKFFNVLVDWGSYISPFVAQLLPFSSDILMWIVGAVEFAVGVSILTALPVVGAYLASAWLLLIAGNLLLGGHLDVAVRDAVLSISAFTLARLVQIRDGVNVRAMKPERATHRSIA